MDVFLAMKSHDYFFNSQIFPDTVALNTIDDYKMRKYYVIDKPYANFIVLREPFANTLKRYIIGESKCVRIDSPPLVLHMSQFCMTSTLKLGQEGKTVICINGQRRVFLSGRELVCLDRLVSSYLEPKSIQAARKIQTAFRRYRERKTLKAAIVIQRWTRSMKERFAFLCLKRLAQLTQSALKRK